MRLWIALTMLMSSAASMALEITAGRLLAPYVGMSLYSWTAIIAVVLAGLSLGHWVGGWLADRPGRSRIVGLALAAAALTSFLSIPVLRQSAPLLLAGTDPVSGIGAIATAAFFLPSFFAGLLSPILTALALAEAPQQGRVLGRMFALGAAGAILGTVGTGFWLMSWIGTAGSVALIAAVYAVLALPFLRRWSAGVLAVGAGIAAFAGQGALRTNCTVESDYYCIRIDPIDVMGRPASVMALDHLAHGVNVAADPRLLVSPYVHLVDEMARRRTPDLQSAFFVGGGAYTLPRAWADRHPDARLVVAEVDPAVTREARERMWVETERLEVLHLDARAALVREAGPFDVIFGDAFHDVSIPQHLVTDEFHALVASRLAPGGFYAINVVEAMREPPFLLSLVQTMQARFDVVELWLDTAELGPAEKRTTWVVIASDTDSGVEHVRSAHGMARDWVRVPTRDMLGVLPGQKLVFLTDDFAPVDRLMRHILFDPDLSE